MGLEVVDLTVKVRDKLVLRKVSLKVDYGTIHAVMGPNGSGKSSLAYAIMGREGYEVVEGDIRLDGESILNLETHERALKGVYIGMQDPPVVPGVKLSTLIVAATNKRRGESELTKMSDPRLVKRMQLVSSSIGLNTELLHREVNVGFSGGERKRSEILQAIMLDPKIVILDEPDSGLDIDGIKKVADYISDLKAKGKAVMLITHYARLLQHVMPDVVTVLIDGEVVARGGSKLALLVEEKGYNEVKKMYRG
ncbi:MAG: Fe-S cluster assembly ATPase SufC [Thermoprotei archaeon]|nr:Fe-S cluster assembly ATPase SufC [Thermoprotei archaeon]